MTPTQSKELTQEEADEANECIPCQILTGLKMIGNLCTELKQEGVTDVDCPKIIKDFSEEKITAEQAFDLMREAVHNSKDPEALEIYNEVYALAHEAEKKQKKRSQRKRKK